MNYCHHTSSPCIPKMNISGTPSQIVSFQITNSDGKILVDDKITLHPDGRFSQEIDIEDYMAGLYFITVRSGSTEATEPFALGHRIIDSTIYHLKTIKTVYHANESILIQGETAPNILLILQLIDPSGIIIEKETFSDKEGKITDSLEIPHMPMYGVWQINATSGSNFDITEIRVVPSTIQEMTITIEGIENISGIGDVVNFNILDATGRVQVIITNEDNGQVDKLVFPQNNLGEVNQLWIIPDDLPSGTYTITATDAVNYSSAELIL